MDVGEDTADEMVEGKLGGKKIDGEGTVDDEGTSDPLEPTEPEGNDISQSDVQKEASSEESAPDTGVSPSDEYELPIPEPPLDL